MTVSQPPVAISSDNTVFELDLPRVLGATQPVVEADVGVSLVIYDLVIDGLGATVEVDPPLVGTVNPNDVIELWLEGETTFLDSEIIVDVNAKTTLRIPKGRLHPDRINELFYIIRRGSDNRGTSDPLTLLYNKIRPGLKDTKPEVDGHSELALLLPDAIKNGVGPDFVSAQVCVSYPYCRAYDTITLKCNGEIMSHMVGQNEAPQPPNPGSPEPITVCFTVTRAYLDSAVRPSGTLDFSYTVTDQLGNTPDTDAVWSASQTVDEDLAGKHFAMPVLLENLDDYPGDDSALIELEKLGSKPLSMFVKTEDGRISIGDRIVAVYTATLTGKPDIVVTVSGVVEGKLGQKLPCVLEVPNDKVLSGYIVTVVYKVFRGETPLGQSRMAHAQVIGEAAIELKPPTLQQAPNNISLDPLAAQLALTAVIPATGLLPTDWLSVTWTGAPGTPAEGSHTTAPRPISEIGLSIALPPAVIAFSLGKPITVTYSITREPAQPQPSQPLVLNVLPLVLGAAYRPKLQQAANSGEGPELHLKDLSTTGQMWFSAWPFIALGQYVWLTLTGTKANGDAYREVIWAAPFAHTNQGWIDNGFFEATAPYEDLIGLKEGSALTMEFKAGLGGSQDEGEAVSFAVRSYTVRAVAHITPRIDSVKGDDVEVPHDTETKSTSVSLQGIVTSGHQVEIYDNDAPKHTVTAVGTTWNTTLAVPVGGHSITAKELITGQVSNTRKFKVIPSPPPLTIDPSPLILDGQFITLLGEDWILVRTYTPPNTTAQRQASGGVLPRRYSSENTSIATVNNADGTVTSKGNGTTRIIVTDASIPPQVVSYTATVTNGYLAIKGPSIYDTTKINAWIDSVGGIAIDPNDYSDHPVHLLVKEYRSVGHEFYAIFHARADRKCLYANFIRDQEAWFDWQQGVGELVPPVAIRRS